MTRVDASTDLRGKKVLILEDDYYQATDLRDALLRCGICVIGPFADAQQALSALQTECPDLALLDVNLGHGPSFDIPRHMAQRKIPFAFVTGYDEGAIPSEFETISHIPKPVEASAIDIIRSLLQER
jgi:two-component SAPR family response regulator